MTAPRRSGPAVHASLSLEPAHARRPSGAGRARARARRLRTRGHHRTRQRPATRAPVQARHAIGRRPYPAPGPGSRPRARCPRAARGHDRRLWRVRRPGSLGLEGRLRGDRGRAGAVPPTLRPRHATRGRPRTRRSRRHAGHAGDPRGPGALADPALRGAAPVPAVLDAAAARLRRAPGRRRPSRRCRPRTLRRHRHARGDGARLGFTLAVETAHRQPTPSRCFRPAAPRRSAASTQPSVPRRQSCRSPRRQRLSRPRRCSTGA